MPTNPKNQTPKLETKIRVCRQQLQELWDDRGITDPEVLNASIKLDNLLNKYQKLK